MYERCFCLPIAKQYSHWGEMFLEVTLYTKILQTYSGLCPKMFVKSTLMHVGEGAFIV